MAEKITKVQRLNLAKDEILALLEPILTAKDAIQTGDYTFAVESEQFPNQYVEITLVAKNPDATTKSPAYNPVEKAEEYIAEKELKAQEKADKDAEKARKKATDEAKRAAAKAAKDAAKASN